MNTCQICNRTIELTNRRHTCITCQIKAATILGDIELLIDEAHHNTKTRNSDGNGTRGKPGSRPPLNVETLDPERTLIPLVQGDPSSSIPIIEMLDMWAVQIRHARHLQPHGPATAANPGFHALITFHRTHLDWFYQHDDDVDVYHQHITSARRALNKWNPNNEDRGIRIPCPTLVAEGDCGRWLTLRTIEIAENITVTCRDGHEWTARRLVYTVGPEADLWLSAEDLATHLGIHRRTVHRWAKRGHIRCRDNRYSWSDARNLNSKETA